MAKKKSSLFTPLCCIAIGCILLVIIFSNKGKSTTTPNGKNKVETVSQDHGEAPDLLEIPKCTEPRQEQIITHTGYTLSYNSDWCVPNWVAYELTRSETSGNAERTNHFDPDPNVKGVCPNYQDYSGSGYDRGHMAPAGDMKWDETAMRECFYLSNICPQNHNLNKGDWNDLEQLIRHWANKYGNVYIACGPIMSNNPETIGRNNVAVPDAFYKVCLAKIKGEWQAIGFIFNNEAGHKELRTYCKSIDEVEQCTGIDFFPKLEDNIEDKIEARYDAQAWGL